MLRPHLKLPLSGVSSSMRILKSIVIACSLFPTKAILSFLRTVKLTLLRSFTPSTSFVSPSTVRISLPTSLSISKPTNHLDLESITAVNNGLSDFKGNVLFCSHDYEIVNTVANRIIEICDDGVIDHSGNYDDFVEFKESRGMEVTTL